MFCGAEFHVLYCPRPQRRAGQVLLTAWPAWAWRGSCRCGRCSVSAYSVRPLNGGYRDHPFHRL